MKRKKIVVLLTVGTMLAAASGCGKSEPVADPTPTPAPTATPAPTSTPTPAPTPTVTPAPKMIGKKTAEAKFIYLSNNTDKQFRKLYLRVSGNADWGNSLIPSESSVHASEKVRMYYTPQTGEGVTYDMRLTDENGNTYEIDGADLSDMETASLRLDTDQGIVYLTYVSKSSNSEKNTKDSSSSTGTEDTSGMDVSSSEQGIYYYNQSNGSSNGGDSSNSGGSQSGDNSGNGSQGTTDNSGNSGQNTPDSSGTTGGNSQGGNTGTDNSGSTGGDANQGGGDIDYDPGDGSDGSENWTDNIIWDEDGNWQ